MGFLFALCPWLAPYRLIVEIGIALALAAAVAFYIHHVREEGVVAGRAEVQAKWDAERVQQQADALKRAQANAKETFRRMEAQQENSDAQARELARYQRVAADAVAARDELQHDFDNLAAVARRGLGDSATASERQAGAAAAGMLADLSRGADSLAEIFAREADSARRAGSLCERDYDALTVKP